jgi:hypothetical protein
VEEEQDVFYDTSGAIVTPFSSPQRWLPATPDNFITTQIISHVQWMGTQKVRAVKMRAMRSACALIKTRVGLCSCALLAACATTKIRTWVPVQD